MDERKAYWFEQPYMPRMKNVAVALLFWKMEGCPSVFRGMMVLRGQGYGT